MLSFPLSKVKLFVHKNKSKTWGQAFYDYMNLKDNRDDINFCERLRQAPETTAMAMVASRTDHSK